MTFIPDQRKFDKHKQRHSEDVYREAVAWACVYQGHLLDVEDNFEREKFISRCRQGLILIEERNKARRGAPDRPAQIEALNTLAKYGRLTSFILCTNLGTDEFYINSTDGQKIKLRDALQPLKWRSF